MSQLHTGLLGCTVINRMQNSVCFDVRCIGGRDRIDLLQVEKQTEAMKVKDVHRNSCQGIHHANRALGSTHSIQRGEQFTAKHV